MVNAMAVDLFLIEGERDAPLECRAWRKAQEEHAAVFHRAIRAIEEHGDDSPQARALDAEGKALAARVLELEATARAAWLWGSKNR